MKPSTLLNSFLYLVLALICVTSIGCGPNFGEKVDLNKTEIFYKGGVTKQDAERLGEKLTAMKFVDGKRKSVQLLKRDDVWEFRMAIGKGGDSKGLRNQMKFYCMELSSAFDGDPVEVHICNSKLESQSVIKGLSGKRYQYENSDKDTIYFYQDIDLDNVKSFAAIASGAQLDPGNSVFHLSKSGDVIEIRMACLDAIKASKHIKMAAADAAIAASNRLFDGKQVDVLVCDPIFDSPDVYSSVTKTEPPAAP